MVKNFDRNIYYEVDFLHGGGMRHESLVESVLSPDEKREKVNLFLAVKKRLPDVSLYDLNELLHDISLKEIEEANQILWQVDVGMDKLIPILSPYYHVNEWGEAEYIPYIDKRLLSTNIEVKLPFRVDIEFKVDYESYRFGYGSTEGSMRFYHGDLRFMYGINMENNPDDRLSQEAICFNQPIFGNFYHYPKLGKINHDIYNRLTWIVGEKHFAVIINDEVRYCSINFPYMTANLHLEPGRPVIIGSNGQGKIFLKSICVTQLKLSPKIKIREGDLTMITKQSNNIIPNIHQLITFHYGENYWFNGCAKYVMECLGVPDYDYWFFAGLTGDNFAQVYANNGAFYGDGAFEYKLHNSDTPHEYFEELFETCGYASTFVYGKDLHKNKEMYVQTLIAYIDKGVPVILYGFGGPPFSVIVGYEEYGKTLLYLTGDATEPKAITIDEAIGNKDAESYNKWGWIFVGEKKEEKALKDIYRDAIFNLSKLLTTKTDRYCFGPEAYRRWAEEIENGRFDNMKPEEFDSWAMYNIYVCNLATNSGGCRSFLNKAQDLNPDFTFLEDVRRQYRITGLLWNAHHEADDGFAEEYVRLNGGVPDNLESLGGGFNITLETLQNPEKRYKITNTIRKFAECMDKVVQILQENLSE